jgi:hypothetical protein
MIAAKETLNGRLLAEASVSALFQTENKQWDRTII